LSGWRHLAARFLDVITSRPLDADERMLAMGWLRPEEHRPFFEQAAADQRHALTSAAFVASIEPGRTDLIRAALLHDLGKRHAGLGWWGRTVAALWHRLGGRPTLRQAMYADHARLGAEELAGLGAEPMVVAVALHHHSEPPAGFPEGDWQLLISADRARRPWERRILGRPADSL
jgi:hypothetical protein